MLCQQAFAGMERWLGLRDREHLTVWSKLEGLGQLVRNLLEDEKERRRISDAGQRFVLEHHSFEARVKELTGIIMDTRWGGRNGILAA